MHIIWPNRTLSLYLCLLSLLSLTLAGARASAQANFTLTAAPAALNITQGTQQSATIVTSISGGFNSSISLSASGMPLGVSAAFNPATISAPGAGTSVMTVTVVRFAPAGNYTLTVTGNGGGIKQTATVTVTVVATGHPTFNLSAAPSALSIVQGNQGSTAITTTVLGGFNSDISLSATGAPSGVAIAFDQNPIPAPGAGVSNMTLTVNTSTLPGTYPITLTASGGGTWQAIAVTLTVTSFTVSAAPLTLSVPPGYQGVSTISVSITNGFNYPVTLSASGMPTDATVSFNPPTIPAPGSGNSTMTLTVASDTPQGTYPITVTGTGGGLQESVVITLTVPAAGFTLAALPTSLTVSQGKRVTGLVTTRIYGGFNAPITCTSTGAPSGSVASCSPATVPAPGVGNITLTIATLPRTAPGNYPVTITATGGTTKQSVTVMLTVIPASPPSFSLQASPAAINVTQGGSGTSSVSSTVTTGFNSAITLSAMGLPNDASLTFAQNPLPAPGFGNTPLVITTAADTPPGTYPLTITGTGGGNQTTTLTVTVVAADSQSIPMIGFMQPYAYTLLNQFGSGPYTYQLQSGALPSGLSMDQSGNISGTASSVGLFPFTVLVTDSSQPPQQQTYDYVGTVAVNFDTYSGLAAAPVPGCVVNNYFQVLKANGRWVLADPNCYAFHQRSVYDADYQFILPQTFQVRYNSDPTKWATHTLQRLQAYGFNALDIYASSYILPVGTWGRHQGASPPLPFVLHYPALNDVVNHPTDLGIPERVKDLCAERDGNGFIGWCQYSLDVFDPKWQTANTGEIANQIKAFTGGFGTTPWIIAISLGDSANVFSLTGNGAGTNGASQYPHPAMLIATINFQATGFIDNTIYSKYAWAAYLQNKYGNIAALNASWDTGGFYTSFGDAGGFAGGTGILDEDGRNPWYGTDPYNRYYTLVGVNQNLVADLNAFLYQYAYQAYAVQASAVRTYDTNHLLVCGSFGGVGDGGTRPIVLQALKDAGCNMFVWNWNAYYPAASLTANEAEYDTSGLPAVIWYGTSAQADSEYSSYPYPKYGAPFGDFPNQLSRGQQYATDMQSIYTSQGTNGDYYVVGTAFWGLTDNTSEKTNWGLFSLMDNAYDGQCAVISQGTDQWGVACGGESANYGDLLDAGTQGNSSVVQQLIQAMQHN